MLWHSMYTCGAHPGLAWGLSPTMGGGSGEDLPHIVAPLVSTTPCRRMAACAALSTKDRKL